VLRLTTLGATDLRNRLGKPVREVLVQPKRLALLIYLAVEGRRGPISRDRLLAMFWPESDTEHARNTLSQALHHLRRALGLGVLESQGVHAIGVDAEKLWCDAVVFTESLERGEAELALDLYRGDFCPTLFVSGAPEVEEWLDEERRRLRGKALAAARTLAERLAAKGDADGAARAARRALAMRPDDEADVRALLAVLERAGDGAGALLAYQEYAKRLATDLETQPAPETRQLIDALRRRREVSIAAKAPATADDAPAGSAAPVATRPPLLSHPRQRTFVLVAVAFVLVASGIVTARSWQRRATPPTTQSVAVFPFAVRGRAEIAYLREGMVDLLSAKLSGTAGVRALDPRAVIAAAGSGSVPDNFGSSRIARRLGAEWYISGDVVEIAGRLQLNGGLYAVGGELQALATASVAGDEVALFQLVDDLAGRLLAGLTRGRDTALTRLAAVTTHSLPALKAFLEGEQALRRGHDAQAAAAFQNAALLDTSFALAQYRLALTSTWVSGPGWSDPVAWATAAARHAQRLTPIVRDLLSAYRAYKEVRADDAERMYRTLTAGYPENVEAWFMLAETLFHYNPLRGRPAMEAWAPFQRVLALDPGNAHAMIHLARLAALEGRADDLDTLAARYRALYQDADRTLEVRALQAYVRDDASERAAVARAARVADDIVAYSLLEAALVYAQNIDAARELAPRFGPEAGAAYIVLHGRRVVTTLGLLAGQWSRDSVARLIGRAVDDDWLLETQVLLAAEPLFPIPRERIAALRDSVAARRPYPALTVPYTTADPGVGPAMQDYLLGLLSVRLGDLVAAERYAARLAAIREAGRTGWSAMLAHGLRAEIARTSGDLRGALAELDRFEVTPSMGMLHSPTHWGARERFLRAEVLHALRRDDEAADLYDSFLSVYDAPFLAVAHLRRAEIHASQGDGEQAAFHYQRFINLWKDCDPEFRPMVARAEQALARVRDTTAGR
jgi:DNA-binding SARP family transcriptional activator/TolB-like protein